MSIDWSGNPEATHFDPVDQNFLREVGSALLLFNKKKGWTVPVHTSYGVTIEDCHRPLIKRPELDSEDLPPEGAQWFEPETEEDFGCFYKERDGATYMWIMNGHRKAWKKSHYKGKPHDAKPMSEYVGPVATVWDGEGLPPAGTVCELKSGEGDWGRGLICYASRNVIVWDWEGEPPINGLCTAYAHAVKLRPIRTAEQIATEERAKEVTHMVGFIRERRMSVSTPENPKQEAVLAAEALYDAGFRRAVQ